MRNIPKVIYLQVDDESGSRAEDFNELDVTWCEDKIHDTDIRYILDKRVKK